MKRSAAPYVGGWIVWSFSPTEFDTLYVISTSSLLATLEFQSNRVQVIHQGMVVLVAAGQLRTTKLAWEAVKDSLIEAEFRACKSDFVLNDMEAATELQRVTQVTGDILLPYDATQEKPEPWLAALALKLQAGIVSETSALSRLPEACRLLNIPSWSLADMLGREGI